MSIIGKYDVIVIGAGIGGLSAAGMTVKEAKNLLVVDQRPALGGGEHVIVLNGKDIHLISGR